MMVKHCGSLVELASVPRLLKPELPIIEMVTELVPQRAQECTERSDLFPHRRSHPNPDQHGFGCIVSKKLGRPSFANSERSGGEYSDAAIRDSVKLRASIQELGTGPADTHNLLRLHCRLDRLCDCR